jgi:hypothetical protein
LLLGLFVNKGPSVNKSPCFRPQLAIQFYQKKIHAWEGGFFPVQLRIPSEKEVMIRKAATKTGKRKTSFIMESVDEKLDLLKSREQIVREMAGWLTHEKAENLRQAVTVFEQVKRRIGLETDPGYQNPHQ